MLLFWLTILLIGVELAARFVLVDWTGVGRRALQPYFMSGDYFESLPYEVMRSREGPEAYGYREQGGAYVYGFDDQVSSIADRGDFLFQDRAALANAPKSDNALRIFIVGGSVAYGVGASTKDQRWYAHLERALTADLGREVKLVPAAMSGYVSTQERLALDLVVLPRQPDAVIILNGFNDAVLPALYGSRPGDPYNQGVLYEQFHSPMYGLQKSLADVSHAYRYVFKLGHRRALEANQRRIAGDPRLKENYARSTGSVYLDNLDSMLRLCRAEDVPCLAFLQPAHAVTERNQGAVAQPGPLDVLTLAAYDEIRRRSGEAGTENTLHDLTPAFDDPSTNDWWIDMVHFTDPGHQALAELLRPVVREVLQAQLAARSEVS